MKKKKSANKGIPYSFSHKLAPLTIDFPSDLNISKDSSLDKIVFSPASEIYVIYDHVQYVRKSNHNRDRKSVV